MNILHISFNEYPQLSIDHATKQIWKELMKDCNEYHIFGRSDDNHFHTEREGKITLHRVPALFGNKVFMIEQFFLFYYMRKYKINLMISQCALLGGIAGTLYSKIYKVPILIEIHGKHYFDILDGKSLSDRVIAVFIRWVYNHATAVRALNSMMRNMLIERNIKANIVIIPNRADLKLFTPPKSKYLFDTGQIQLIAVGSFVQIKGHSLLIDLVKKLSKEYPIKLVLIGGGELMKRYQSETKGFNCFQFYEKLSQKNIVKLLSQSDIFLQPSYSEAVPRAIIEAMAMGLPIVASDAGMIEGLIINEKNGLLFPVGNTEVLEIQVRRLIENEDLRAKLGRAAYEDAKENYDWNENFEKYRNVLRGLVKC